MGLGWFVLITSIARVRGIFKNVVINKLTFFSLLESNKGKRTTVQDVEDILDGNLCRCTGYRPIFDAFKSMTNTDVQDIEDLRKCPKSCSGSRAIRKIKSSIEGVDWYMPTTVNDLMSVLAQLPGGTNYRYLHTYPILWKKYR